MVSLDQSAAPKGAAVPHLRELTSGVVFGALMKYRSQLAFAAFFSGVINLLYLAPALYMLQIYDRVLTSQSVNTLIALTGLVIGLLIVTGLLETVRSSIMARIGDALDHDLSPRMYSAMFAQQLKAPSNQGNQPLWDLQQVRQFFSGSGLYALFDLPWLPIFLATIFLLHPVLGWFVLAGSLVLLGITLAGELLVRAPAAESSQWTLAANGAASSQLRNAEVIEALGMLPQLASRWRALQSRGRDLQLRAFERMALTGGFTRVLRMVLQSGTLGLGAWLAIKGDLTPGAMIAAAILATRALAPLDLLLSHWKSLIAAMLSAGRLDKLLTDFPLPVKGMAVPRPAGRVAVENIFVSSPKSTNFILKGMSFTLSPKEVLGVIGPSAAGKSTLARTLVGVWNAQLGIVRFDGSDIRNLDKSAIGSAIGYLPQDIELFSGSVADNISRFSSPNADHVIAAASACGIHDMVLGLPTGYDTPIGEAGATLSGGQRQLIGLARALFGRPSLIVLDEPSSNLDDLGKQSVAKAIEAAKTWGSTLVVISHDPAILHLTDRIMVIQAGQIHALGPTESILNPKRPGRKEQSHVLSH